MKSIKLLRVEKGERMNSIEIKHLTKSFGDIKAVDDLSFSVEKGTFFSFLGSVDSTTVVGGTSAALVVQFITRSVPSFLVKTTVTGPYLRWLLSHFLKIFVSFSLKFILNLNN